MPDVRPDGPALAARASRYPRTAGICLLALSFLLPGVPAGIANSGPQEQGAPLELSTSEILVDIVASDKERRPVLDLKPEEIEVYENGIKQDVTSFELVRVGSTPREAPAAITEDVVPVSRSSFRGVNLILVVVDRTSIDPSNLPRVSRAAERFFNERLAINDLVAIYAVTNKLVLLQNFTNNKQRLVSAIKTATRPTAGTLSASGSGAATISTVETLPPNAIDLLSSAVLNVERAYAQLVQQIQAKTIVRSLIAIARAYGNIPGRKSLVLYSEGFVIASENEDQFDAMLGSANRANVTIHTVDAAGLVVREVSPPQRRRRAFEEPDDRILVGGGESGMDRMLRPQIDDRDSALQRLSSETGGVFVRNSNDFGRGFQAIENDLRAYYAVTYSPNNTDIDGTYRRIDVRIARKDIRIRARKGYFAIPGGSDGVLYPFERPVLAAIAASKPAARRNDLPVWLKAEYFRLGGVWNVALLLSTEARSLKPADDSDATAKSELLFQLDAVALVRDDTNTVISKLSRSSQYKVAPTQRSEFNSSTIPLGEFTEPLLLPPGHYSLLVGMRDPVSDATTVLERTITLPEIPREGTPLLSSLVLGQQIQTVPDIASRSGIRDPFRLNTTTRLVPNPTGRFYKSRGDRLIALVRLHTVPGTRLQARLQFLSDDQVVLATPLTPLAPTDSMGESAYAPIITLDSLKPGQYRAQVAIYLPNSPKPLATVMTTLTIET